MHDATQQTPASVRDAAFALLLVFACFTFSTSGYLGWLYHLMGFAEPAAVDALTMGAGYLCQALGIGAAALLMRSRPEVMGRVPLVAAIALHFACAAPAALGDTLGATLAFGYAMSLLCGFISAFYLLRLAQCVRAERRGVVFGGGYACSVVATWLLSNVPAMAPGDVPNDLVWCAVFSIVAVVVAAMAGETQGATAAGAGTGASAAAGAATGAGAAASAAVDAGAGVGSATAPFDAQSASPTRATLACGPMSIVALACITVLLMSLVKNTGFNFPTATIDGSLEFSRLLYAVGLIVAGIVMDRSRKFGSILCLAALVTPFALMVLANEPLPGAVLWALDYLFYGFFSVFRVVLLADLSSQRANPALSGLGLMFGRIGDALGAFVVLSLGGSLVALVTVAMVLFAATVFAFSRLFQQLYMPAPAPQRDEREVLAAFCARFGLSMRERDVLPPLVAGKTYAEIAVELFISENTVKYHVRNILKKTSCASRLEVAERYEALARE